MITTLNECLNWLIISMIFNSIFLFCLLSPNIVYLIHKKWFMWKKDELKDIIEFIKELSTEDIRITGEIKDKAIEKLKQFE